MRMSQYLDEYLEGNKLRGEGKGLTIGSFLTYTLRGKARDYTSKYARSLEVSCERVGARQGKSYLGMVAYYPRTDGENI